MHWPYRLYDYSSTCTSLKKTLFLEKFVSLFHFLPKLRLPRSANQVLLAVLQSQINLKGEARVSTAIKAKATFILFGTAYHYALDVRLPYRPINRKLNPALGSVSFIYTTVCRCFTSVSIIVLILCKE